MKRFKLLTRAGRVRKLHELAQNALSDFGLQKAKLSFLAYNGNAIYRVFNPKRDTLTSKDKYYLPNNYVLRVHMDYHSKQAINSELRWLRALKNDMDLPVPLPLTGKNNESVIEQRASGYSDTRYCTLLRWVDGRFACNNHSVKMVESWGELMSGLHNHAHGWEIPSDFERPSRDWNGMFGSEAGFDHSLEEITDLIPSRFKEAYQTVTGRIKNVMGKLGRKKDVYGLVHADLNLLTNILFSKGQARVIDFDDCCFGYWLHDLAFALAPWQGHKNFDWVRDCFLRGYNQNKTFPESQLKYLDLFLAGFSANLMLWELDFLKDKPGSKESRDNVSSYGRNLLAYCNKI